MLFTWSSVSFIFFSIIFVGASAVSSVFILPLLFLSFIFSGLVVIFSGLSYTTFKLASSKYNHTVLFLNKLLRKLADNIPPAVGFEEIQQAKQSPWKDLGLPSLRLSERFNKLYGLITYPFTKKPELETPSTAVEKQDFQVEQADSAVPVIYDDEEPNLENGIEEPLVEPTPIVDQEEKPSPPDDQPIKDSEVDNNED